MQNCQSSPEQSFRQLSFVSPRPGSQRSFPQATLLLGKPVDSDFGLCHLCGLRHLGGEIGLHLGKPIHELGSAARTRTSNLQVNSLLLYH